MCTQPSSRWRKPHLRNYLGWVNTPVRTALATVAVLVLAHSQEAPAQDPVSDPPAAPQGFSAYPTAPHSWSVELYWIPNSETNLDHYELDVTGDPCSSLKEEYCGVFVVPGSQSTYVFNNQNLVQFHWYLFRLRAVNTDGFASPWSRSIIISSTDTQDQPVRPDRGLTLSHLPNPFNASTRISFTLDSAGPVTLGVFDALGRRVRTLVSEPFPPGVHTVTWFGTDQAGLVMATGVYFLKLEVRGAYKTSRLVLLR